MRLGRDSQFASFFWLSVTFVLGVAAYSTVSIGDSVTISDVDFVPVFPRFACSETHPFFSPRSRSVLRSPFVSPAFVCTRRPYDENELLLHGEGVCPGGDAVCAVEHMAKVSLAGAMPMGFGGLIPTSDRDDPISVTGRLWLPGPKWYGDVCVVMLLAQIQSARSPATT